MADMQTVIERRGSLAGSKWAWLGDGNNVLHSIVEAGSLMGFEVMAACPEGYDPDPDVIGAATNRGGRVRVVRDAARRCGAPTSSSPTPGSRWARTMPRRSSRR